MRWWLFKKRQAQSERLPPTEDALHFVITPPPPVNYGWNMINNKWVAVIATEKPAHGTVLYFVKF